MTLLGIAAVIYAIGSAGTRIFDSYTYWRQDRL